MNAPKERILVVESDPVISDLITRQTLVPLGYRVKVVGAASSALQDAVRFSPDLIIANLNLPGLSGKDLLVAFSAQGFEVPIIVVVEEGSESDVIQAFRLGAADYLGFPLREAEIVSAVERILKQIRSRREKEMLSRQLNDTNRELHRRVRELTTIFAIGKAVISITDIRTLFDKIVEGAVYVTEAEVGWLLTRHERTQSFVLSAFRNLPRSISSKLNNTWDDGLSSLVAISGETLAIHGDPLKRFAIYSLGQSALVVPVKIKKEVFGLLVVVRKAPQPFSSSSQALLEAVADYASVSMVNAQLFRALEERVNTSQQEVESALFGEKIGRQLLHLAGEGIYTAADQALTNLEELLEHSRGKLTRQQSDSFSSLKNNLVIVDEMVESMRQSQSSSTNQLSLKSDLNELVRFSIQRHQFAAQNKGVSLFTDLFSHPIHILAKAFHVTSVIDGLLSNAIRYSPRGEQIIIRVTRTQDNKGLISIKDNGPGIEEQHLESIFSQTLNNKPRIENFFSGLGIKLNLAREIVSAYGGHIWVESKPGHGALFQFVLPVMENKKNA